nr:hypothetical protein [Saccharothrix syringae]
MQVDEEDAVGEERFDLVCPGDCQGGLAHAGLAVQGDDAGGVGVLVLPEVFVQRLQDVGAADEAW